MTRTSIFPTSFRTASKTMLEQRRDHREHRRRVRSLRVQQSESVRPVASEDDQLLVQRTRPLVVASVLLDSVQRRGAMLPGGRQALLADVRRVGERAHRCHVARQTIPDRSEHLTVLHVRVMSVYENTMKSSTSIAACALTQSSEARQACFVSRHERFRPLKPVASGRPSSHSGPSNR